MTFNFHSDGLTFDGGGASINNQDVSITQNGEYTAESGYTGLGTVTVDVPTGGGGSQGEYLVQAIDYDGTVLKSEYLNQGDTFTLPDAPSHTGLIFQNWSCAVQIVNGAITVPNSDVTVGAYYVTSSGLSEFDIVLTPVTGLTVNFKWQGTKNWGDGTAEDTLNSHTYADYGNYTITVTGDYMATSSNAGLFYQGTNSRNGFLFAARLANVKKIYEYAFSYCSFLKYVTIPETVKKAEIGSFMECYALKAVVLPKDVTEVGQNSLAYCYTLKTAVIPYGVTTFGNSVFGRDYRLQTITLPETLTTIGSNTFQSCHSLEKITMPANITAYPTGTLTECYALKKINYPNTLTSIGQSAFSSCKMLENFVMPATVTSIGPSCITGCEAITVFNIPSISSIPSSSFSNCTSVSKVSVPATVGTLSAYVFSGNYQVTEYDFTHHASIPTLSNSNAFSNMNQHCQIKVPSSLAATWKTSTNWSTYANNIVGV